MALQQTARVKSSSARRYRAPHIPMSVIRRYARQIAEMFRPEKIILFGSFAYGTPRVDSDVDLLVVMPAANPVSQAVRIRLALPAPFAMDLLVRTPENLQQRIAEGNWFLREVVEKGKVLYATRNSTLGKQGRKRSGMRDPTRRKHAAPKRRNLLPLSTICREVPQSSAPRTRISRSSHS
jgi:predicted nucleotidyltransferase